VTIGSLPDGPQLPAKCAVAIIVRNANNEFLAVRRSDNDASLPGLWGLPAVVLAEGESYVEAAIRACRVKLGVDCRVGRLVGEGSVQRRTFILHMKEYEVEILSGQPSVPQADWSISQYVDMKYVSDPNVLVESARQGSLCSRIMLRTMEVEWENYHGGNQMR
jgi:ADP-ribose pyrophosphatase YjhB (NUDIX family)